MESPPPLAAYPPPFPQPQHFFPFLLQNRVVRPRIRLATFVRTLALTTLLLTTLLLHESIFHRPEAETGIRDVKHGLISVIVEPFSHLGWRVTFDHLSQRGIVEAHWERGGGGGGGRARTHMAHDTRRESKRASVRREYWVWNMPGIVRAGTAPPREQRQCLPSFSSSPFPYSAAPSDITPPRATPCIVCMRRLCVRAEIISLSSYLTTLTEGATCSFPVCPINQWFNQYRVANARAVSSSW